MRTDDRLVGMISLSRRAPGSAEIGFWTAADARGKGLLTEAASAVIDHGFEPTGMSLDRLEWNAAAGNAGTGGVFGSKRNGMTYGVQVEAWW